MMAYARYTFLAKFQSFLNLIVFDAAVFKSVASPLQMIEKGLLRGLCHTGTMVAAVQVPALAVETVAFMGQPLTL